ncbi:uncharacterized protein LOC142168868 [Nicotiana tabacum]|uniref:Uncharacterized protein LOC142168868 n=1 Tax=Nicotiana tabacum TaxID=4097 RepID=A0AC58SMD1_TOBAC
MAKQPQPIVAKPPPPFPQRLQKMKDNTAYKKFLDILKQVQINIPLVDILQEVPKYAKYIKEIVANKCKLTEFDIVALTEECSSRIYNKLSPKLKDPGSFIIQISIGKHVVGRALCDLEASINPMPLYVFLQLGSGDPRPTMVVLQLADRSLANPEGIIEDVLVQVGTFIFPANFVILDYEPNQEVLFILGRPFLATSRAIIDVCEGQMTMRVGTTPYLLSEDPLGRALIYEEEEEDELGEEFIQVLNMTCQYINGLKRFKEIDRPLTLTPPKPSIEEAPKLELKPLPSHLRYTYLGVSESLPVIILSLLSHVQEDKFMRVLREHKGAIGWTIADIKGISPSFCMHKILLEEFDLEIRDRKGTENQVADQLSRLENHE